jgi:hypothetical protein
MICSVYAKSASEDLTESYNERAATPISRSAFVRALARRGYVFKKGRRRPAEHDRPEVEAKREQHRQWAETIDGHRLVFVDESAANLSMGRDYAWIQRSQELHDPRPMNWGTKSLTMIGALRATGWVALGILWGVPQRRVLREVGQRPPLPWALLKSHTRKHAPRIPDALRRVAQRARYLVNPHHCAGWIAHAGYRLHK